ncbi:MAG: prepilin-type N-terminal cleavage/methylation domain-containing protein [Candidatus Aminicenantes bacterium]|nr:prepilin-type N-terminal cleavage/methylation domain-containing protein [Candidatus Aminicenantes bacterium]
MGEKLFNSPRRARLRAGFTLIEALIGMAITGIALLGMAQLFLISIANNTRGGEISQATFLAQQRIDDLRSLTDAELAEFPSASRGESVDEQIDMNQDGTLECRRITQVQVSGHAYTVKVLVFPASQNGVAKDTLLQDPSSYRLRAEMNTVIGR